MCVIGIHGGHNALIAWRWVIVVVLGVLCLKVIKTGIAWPLKHSGVAKTMVWCGCESDQGYFNRESDAAELLFLSDLMA
jgi:hypothetical protein